MQIISFFRDEFDLVYHWLFSSENDIELRRKAYEKLLVWKVRRLNLTPATILSTLSILEVQLKDASNECSVDDLRKMYSNAFTRFLNFVSSILHSRSLPTMYSTARELGIESFIVDLRHLCAHGQVLPSIEICRRTAVYCMNWIRKFYWDRELNVITDANASDVRLKSSLELENLISECFQLYEISTEAISKGFKIVSELLNDKNIQFENIHLLETFVEQNPHSKITLKFVASKMINTLAALSNHEECQRHKENIFCDNFIGCKLFMDHTASVYDEKIFDKRLKFIHVHQNLFRLFAISDFINALFNRLVIICEDDCESDERRKAASFWCNEIAHGFRLFKEFKNFYKSKKEKKANYDLDLTSINNDVMTDDVKEIYRKLGTDTRGTLIFGDTVRRPWSLHFDRNFLMDRVVNLNEFTVELVKK